MPINKIKRLVIVGLLACAVGGASSVFGQRSTPVKAGTWGGGGLNLTVTATNASLQFDCAVGEITKRLVASRNGSFDLGGTFTPSGPGPIRLGREPQAQPVHYKGKVSGKKLTLRIVDVKTGETFGTFELHHGVEGRIHRCL